MDNLSMSDVNEVLSWRNRPMSDAGECYGN